MVRGECWRMSVRISTHMSTHMVKHTAERPAGLCHRLADASGFKPENSRTKLEREPKHLSEYHGGLSWVVYNLFGRVVDALKTCLFVSTPGFVEWCFFWRSQTGDCAGSERSGRGQVPHICTCPSTPHDMPCDAIPCHPTHRRVVGTGDVFSTSLTGDVRTHKHMDACMHGRTDAYPHARVRMCAAAPVGACRTAALQVQTHTHGSL